MIPTMHLRFVKRRVGKNVVRILQQMWEGKDLGEAILAAPIKTKEWRDVEMADGDGKATVK